MASDEYTPSPETVLKTAAGQAGWDAAEFARVLAAHDAEVAAKAWDEGYSHLFDAEYGGDPDVLVALSDNPYRIENGATDE